MPAQLPDTKPFQATLVEASGRKLMHIVVPEGVPLSIEIPMFGERMAAFAIDVIICLCLLLTVAVAVELVAPALFRDVVLFAAFLIRNAYFISTEICLGGATPGKRLLRLGVINRAGKALEIGSILTRNIMREVECFVPVNMLLVGDWIFDGWQVLPVFIWIGFFAAFPLLNSQVLRAGDLVAGTLVIAVPKTELPSELTERSHGHVFSAAQLRAYGESELHILESVLRQPPGTDTQLRQMIAQRIQKKTGWQGQVSDIDAFLQDFYTAQRAQLEHRRQLGRPRRSKHDAV